MTGFGATGEFATGEFPDIEPPEEGGETGLRPHSRIPSVAGLSADEAVEAVKEWFFENYENPAESVMYVSAEGGYQWVFGPYETSEVIVQAFAGQLSDNLIERAVDEINDEGGPEWTAAMHRVIGDESDYESRIELGPIQIGQSAGAGTADTTPSLAEIHADVVRRLDEVEQKLSELAPHGPGIGHNNPPEKIASPISDEERDEILSIANIVKSQPVAPVAVPTEVKAASARLATLAQKIGTYCAKQGDTFVTAAAEAAGKVAGPVIVGAVAVHLLDGWQKLGALLYGAAEAIGLWLNALSSGF
jgi:hypothetical protein